MHTVPAFPENAGSYMSLLPLVPGLLKPTVSLKTSLKTKMKINGKSHLLPDIDHLSKMANEISEQEEHFVFPKPGSDNTLGLDLGNNIIDEIVGNMIDESVNDDIFGTEMVEEFLSKMDGMFNSFHQPDETVKQKIKIKNTTKINFNAHARNVSVEAGEEVECDNEENSSQE